MSFKSKKNLLLTLAFLFPMYIMSQWAPKITPIRTQWGKNIDTANPLPEYPRPQMVRSEWLNLNGYWEFKRAYETDAVPVNTNLGGRILVPFPIQSTLSGVVKHYDRIWYRRTFSVPAEWTGKRILMHFGAIDWESEVYINGSSMGIHKGGYDAFYYDITDKISGTGTQEVIIRVFDPTRDYGQPRGKQTTAPGGAMYTPVTGIWQTVWLEPVAERNIENFKMIPDIDNGLLAVTVNTKDSTGLKVTATVKDGGTILSATTASLNEPFNISVANAKLWSPENPFLYDISFELKKGDITLDTIASYFGMRKISRNTIGGVNKLYLNNKFVFQMGPLDQGYWPEGIYTAPTDEALKYDIEITKALGFNMTRKHLKVEPKRWYYWADKLGILVWQDMPSANSYDTPSGVVTDETAHELEMKRMIENNINSPAIVMWVNFNEGCGQFDTKGRVDLVRSLDPSRLVNQGSGGMVATPVSAGDVIDAHRYPAPLCEFQPNQASVSGEYGGVFYKVSGHQWGNPGSNTDHAFSTAELVNMYSSLADQVTYYKTFWNLSAAIYTQITDVETEINGLLTYDRIPKVDVNLFKAINERIINEKVVSFVDVLPASQKTAQTWKYSTTQPASNWASNSFDDSNWKKAYGGFGTSDTPGGIIRTNWNTSDIWLRQQFTMNDVNRDELPKLAINIHHDDECEVYINGVLAAKLNGYTAKYELNYIKKEARNVIIPGRINTIAVYCKQHGGGQFIDAGIVKIINSNDTTLAFAPRPFTGATNQNTQLKLQWRKANLANSYKLYLGIDPNLVDSNLLSTQTDTFYNATGLKQGVKYFWRVDAVNQSNTKTGYTWNFTTQPLTGINNLENSISDSYPNPVKNGEILHVRSGNAETFEEIEIWSSSGSLVYKQKIVATEVFKLNTSEVGLKTGLYFIRTGTKNSFSVPQKILYYQ